MLGTSRRRVELRMSGLGICSVVSACEPMSLEAHDVALSDSTAIYEITAKNSGANYDSLL